MKTSLFSLLFCFLTGFTLHSQAFSISDFTQVGNLFLGSVGSLGDVTTDISLLGGEIDFVVTNNNGATNVGVSQESFFMGTDLDGSIEYTWDGVDGDPFNTSFANVVASLGNCGDITINFSESSFGASVLDFDMTLEMYNSASNFISWTGPVSIADVPVSVQVNTSMFQDFGGTFDFNNVRAIKVILSTQLGSNLEADILSLSWVPDISPDANCDPMPAPPIPTLSEWGLICLGLMTGVLGILFIRQRKTLIA